LDIKDQKARAYDRPRCLLNKIQYLKCDFKWSETMPENPFSLTADDVTIDESGRVIVHNPEIAAALTAAARPAPAPRPPNGNCFGTCNTVAHCGARLQ
jgi:hypothetical protein